MLAMKRTNVSENMLQDSGEKPFGFPKQTLPRWIRKQMYLDYRDDEEFYEKLLGRAGGLDGLENQTQMDSVDLRVHQRDEQFMHQKTQSTNDVSQSIDVSYNTVAILNELAELSNNVTMDHSSKSEETRNAIKAEARPQRKFNTYNSQIDLPMECITEKPELSPSLTDDEFLAKITRRHSNGKHPQYDSISDRCYDIRKSNATTDTKTDDQLPTKDKDQGQVREGRRCSVLFTVFVEFGEDDRSVVKGRSEHLHHNQSHTKNVNQRDPANQFPPLMVAEKINVHLSDQQRMNKVRDQVKDAWSRYGSHDCADLHLNEELAASSSLPLEQTVLAVFEELQSEESEQRTKTHFEQVEDVYTDHDKPVYSGSRRERQPIQFEASVPLPRKNLTAKLVDRIRRCTQHLQTKEFDTTQDSYTGERFGSDSGTEITESSFWAFWESTDEIFKASAMKRRKVQEILSKCP